jgi:hypothetical protein
MEKSCFGMSCKKSYKPFGRSPYKAPKVDIYIYIYTNP